MTLSQNEYQLYKLSQIIKQEQIEFDKLSCILKMDKNKYQPWPPHRLQPLFYYEKWIDTIGCMTIFYNIILIEPFGIFKPGWHFNKVIFNTCQFTLIYQNIDEFIPNHEIRYKEYTCYLQI